MFVISANIEGLRDCGMWSFLVDEANVSSDVVLLAEKCSSKLVLGVDDMYPVKEYEEFKDLMKRLGQSEAWKTFGAMCKAAVHRKYNKGLTVVPKSISRHVFRFFHIRLSVLEGDC